MEKLRGSRAIGGNTPQSPVHWEAEMGQEARPGCDVQALPSEFLPHKGFINLPKWCHQLGAKWSNGKRDTSALNHNNFQ